MRPGHHSAASEAKAGESEELFVCAVDTNFDPILDLGICLKGRRTYDGWDG
jgi:hypothetical protein